MTRGNTIGDNFGFRANACIEALMYQFTGLMCVPSSVIPPA